MKRRIRHFPSTLSQSIRWLASPAHYGLLLVAALPSAMVRVIATVYLITQLEMDPFTVGCYVYGSTLLGMVVTYFAGRGHIDRQNPVLLTLASLSASILNIVCLALAFRSPFFLIASACFGGISQLLIPALFMYDEGYHLGKRKVVEGMYGTRLLVSIVWIVGPPLAFHLYDLGGFSLVLVGCIICGAMAFVGVFLETSASGIEYISHDNDRQTEESAIKEPSSHRFSYRELLSVFSVMVFVTSANLIHSMTMPIYLLKTLAVPINIPGIVMMTAAATEVVAIYLIPKLARRISEKFVLQAGLGAGLVYFALLLFATNPWVILGMQVLYGAHFAFSTVVCLGLLKAISKNKVGSIAAQFLNAGKIGSLLGSAIFAAFANVLGYYHLITSACIFLIFFAALSSAFLPRSQ
ncbi:MFS transporter [Agrobacterium rhizogenes]|nr:MFS transporter [Rhizobium rhizogenes]NTJ81335.1 MFS transporter [Rhizobium rhizogenes]